MIQMTKIFFFFFGENENMLILNSDFELVRHTKKSKIK